MSSFRRRQERDNTDDIELHDVTHSSRPRDMESIVSENSDLSHQNQPIQIHDNNQQNLSSDNQKKPKNGKPWYSFLDHSALILENKGSVARDHMANERTFLAWTRTGSIFLTLAVTFLQFVHLSTKSNTVTIGNSEYDLTEITNRNLPHFQRYGRAIVILGISLSISCVMFATMRFFHTQTLLTRDQFPAGRIAIGFIVVLNMAMVLTLLVFEIRISQ